MDRGTDEMRRYDSGFCKGFYLLFLEPRTRHGWISDAIAKRSTRANVERLGQILDKAALRDRVEEIDRDKKLSGPGSDAVSEFLGAWRRHDKNLRD